MRDINAILLCPKSTKSISVSDLTADALNKIAAEYPDQKFALVDMAVEQPNVASSFQSQ